MTYGTTYYQQVYRIFTHTTEECLDLRVKYASLAAVNDPRSAKDTAISRKEVDVCEVCC